MDIPSLIVLGLATWRLSSLLVWEDGPFHLFARIRELAGIKHDEDGKPFMIPDRFWATLLSCVWCASVWVATGWFVLWIFLPKLTMLGATVFALSGAAIFFEQHIHRH